MEIYSSSLWFLFYFILFLIFNNLGGFFLFLFFFFTLFRGFLNFIASSSLGWTSTGRFLRYHGAETLDRSLSYLLFPHGLDNGKPPNGLLAVVVHALGCTIKSLSPGIRQPGITLAASSAISI